MGRPVRRPCAPVIAAALLAGSCGGGSRTPSGPSTPPATLAPADAGVVLTLRDGGGQPILGATVKVDGTTLGPRSADEGVYVVERTRVGHALDVEKDGFLVHQALVPDRDRVFDLFAVPDGASKAWVQAFLYDGVISRNRALARLLKGVSIVRGTSVSPETWTGVREVWDDAAARMTAVTGYPFRLEEQAAAGTAPFTVELDPALDTGAYFEWTGTGNSIDRGTVRFRSAARLGQLSLVLHELTHGFGFSHSDRTVDVMHPSAVTVEHSERERVMVAAVKRRPPGTTYEDNVRAVASSLGAGTTGQSFRCGRR